MGNARGVKRDFDALEKRRFAAHKLLTAGVHQSEVARRLGVHRQSVSRWAAALEKQGKDALRKAKIIEKALGHGTYKHFTNYWCQNDK